MAAAALPAASVIQARVSLKSYPQRELHTGADHPDVKILPKNGPKSGYGPGMPQLG
jgi:hypothetical protein